MSDAARHPIQETAHELAVSVGAGASRTVGAVSALRSVIRGQPVIMAIVLTGMGYLLGRMVSGDPYRED